MHQEEEKSKDNVELKHTTIQKEANTLQVHASRWRPLRNFEFKLRQYHWSAKETINFVLQVVMMCWSW